MEKGDSLDPPEWGDHTKNKRGSSSHRLSNILVRIMLGEAVCLLKLKILETRRGSSGLLLRLGKCYFQFFVLCPIFSVSWSVGKCLLV